MTTPSHDEYKRVLKPSDVPEAQAIISRLCQLQHDVVEVIDPRYESAADCFCGEGGYWGMPGPHFSNAGKAIDFIEATVRAALAARTPVDPGPLRRQILGGESLVDRARRLRVPPAGPHLHVPPEGPAWNYVSPIYREPLVRRLVRRAARAVGWRS